MIQCLNGRAPQYLPEYCIRSPVLTRAGICDPATVTYLAYRVSGSTLTGIDLSQLLARWPGTLCLILARMQQAV